MEEDRHLKITVNENSLEENITQLIHNVKPSWNTAKMKTKLMTDGITNKLVLCKNVSDDGDEEHVLVRIYGHKTDLLIDREAEIRNIRLLHHYDLAPCLFATFNNGLVYDFIPGRTLTPEDVYNPKIYRLVAKKMAKMHYVVQQPSPDVPKPHFLTKMKQFADLVPDKFSDEKKQKAFEKQNFSKKQLYEEIRQFSKLISEFDMDIVFSHNDLLLGNVIYNESENKVSFIDYEYACFNYQPFDIANHFTEYAGVNDIDYSRFPDKQLQLDWLKTYLMEYKDVPCVSETDLEYYYVLVNKFVLASHLFWYSWSLIQAEHSYIDFDFIEYAATRIEDYLKRKPEILALQFPKST